MSPLTLHEQAGRRKARQSRELEVRACESSLWVALFNAHSAGLDDLAAQIAALHSLAGHRRRLLEDRA